jgi:outer membrane protein
MKMLAKLGLLMVAFTAMPVWASGACDPSQDECVELGRWQLSLGVGVGLRTNPLEDADDIPLVLLPMVNYNGERFFIQNLDFGAILLEAENHQLNLLLTPGYDQVFFNRWDPLNFVVDNSGFATAGDGRGKEEEIELPVIDTSVSGSNNFGDRDQVNWRDLSERHLAGLAGLEYTWSTSVVDLQLHWLKDVTKVHEGEEGRIALAKFWNSDRHRYGVSVGAVWQSEEIINYYFGVKPDEADVENQYETGSGVSTLVRFDWNYKLSKRWDLRALVSYRHFPPEISSSPLIKNNNVVTAFVGGVYHF